MTLEKYINEIFYLRERMHEIVSKSYGDGTNIQPVSSEFYELQEKLNKVWKNCQAWCRRNGVEFPSGI